MTFEQILTFLDGKKAVIVGVLLTILSYLVTVGQLDNATATMISTIITLIFGGAEVATPKVLGRRIK